MSSTEETTRQNNPLLQRLSPDQFQASVRFYEADHNLTPQDRIQLAHDLERVVPRIGVGSYLCGITGFFGLTLYDKLKNRNAKPQSLKVAPSLLMPGKFIKKPFVSFCIALVTMAVSSELIAKQQFSSQIEALSEDATRKRQLDVWKTMDHHQASIFLLYYAKSSQDPSFILKDPRTFTPQRMHEVHVSKPHTPSPNSVFKRPDNREVVDPQTKELTHWEQIRIANGFGQSAYKYAPAEDAKTTEDTQFVSDDAQTSDSVPTPAPKSAWDRVRQGSSK